MYWTDSGEGKIQRADLDGSNSEIVLELEGVKGIVLDSGAGKDVHHKRYRRQNPARRP